MANFTKAANISSLKASAVDKETIFYLAQVLCCHPWSEQNRKKKQQKKDITEP